MKTEMQREYEQLCRIDENPGVQGLAQLGRNAINRVSRLESQLARAGARIAELEREIERLDAQWRDDSMIIGAIRQQSADIAELKVDVSGLRSSEAVFKFECDQLRTKLGEMVGRSKASRDDLHRALGRTDDTIIRLEHELSLSRLATERHKTHIDQCGEELKTTRAKLAAVVAERDEARTAYQVRNTEWHQRELIALALAERYKLRAEQAEARLSAIDVAPVVACNFDDTRDPQELDYDEREE